jgi:hypothetical protein
MDDNKTTKENLERDCYTLALKILKSGHPLDEPEKEINLLSAFLTPLGGKTVRCLAQKICAELDPQSSSRKALADSYEKVVTFLENLRQQGKESF